MNNNELYIKRCLQLAQLGGTQVAPNPQVGCVIVHNQYGIIGEGWHQKYGEPHAEVNAFKNIPPHLEQFIPECTLYVNLEPCAHFGKTPPCTQLLIQKKIKKVVIGCTDINPLVAGKGIQQLENEGIEVVKDVLKAECLWHNRRFFTYIHQHRPYLILKYAQTRNNFIAPLPPQPFAISNATSLTLSHYWRTTEQAILVGANTARIDNPQLTARLHVAQNPLLRIVINPQNNLPKNLYLLDNQVNTLIFIEKNTTPFPKNTEKIEYASLDFSQNVPIQICHFLYQKNIASVIIEGGSTTLQQFINAQLFDEIRIFTAPNLTFISGVPAPILPFHLLIRIKSEAIAHTNFLEIYTKKNNPLFIQKNN